MSRPLAFVGAALVLALAAMAGPGSPIAAAADEAISGSGSSWSANAMNQWTADEAAKGVEIAFTSSSSGQGRQDFAQYQQDFANSDIPYQTKDPLTGEPDVSSRDFAYMPIIAGGTALMYQLRQGSNLVTNLRLSGDTIARIFTGKITNWSDPAITADMAGHALPAKKIQVVVASGGSGTTAQFTDWLAKQYGPIWQSYAGADKATSYYPVNAPNITAQGNDSTIAGTITSEGYDGAIGYVQYSYALNAHYPVAKVLNAAHYYTAPTPYNVAVALTAAQIDTNVNDGPSLYLTQELANVYSNPDPRTYPLSSYSYSIIPTNAADRRIDDGKAKTFADFSYYFLCEGQQEAPQLGYSPLPLNLVQAGMNQVKRFSRVAQNPGDVQNLDPTKCNNPTFDPNNPSANRLAEIDPAPQGCDQQGQGPCGTDNTSDPLHPGNSGGSGAGAGKKNGGAAGSGGTGSGTGTGTSNGSSAASVDPLTGQTVGDGGGDGSGTGDTSTELAAYRTQGTSTLLDVLAVLELVLVLVVPAVVTRAIVRRRTGDRGGNN